MKDPWIPPDMEIPRRGAVPVRFFGTYNFTWIESQRNLMPYDIGLQEDLSSKGTQKVGSCEPMLRCIYRSLMPDGAGCQGLR